MSFTIQNVLIPVEGGYETAEVQVVDNCISALAKLAAIGSHPTTPLLIPRVWVNGQQIVAAGKVKTIDVDDLRKELFDRSEWTSKRQSAMVSEIEAHYR